MSRTFRNYLGFAVGLLLVLSLALFAVPITQKGKYTTALQDSNPMAKSFTVEYPAQNPEVQKKWKQTITPELVNASAGLDAFGLAMLLFGCGLIGLAWFKRKFGNY